MTSLPPPPPRPDTPGAMPPPALEPALGPRYASFWQRAGAFVIDGLVLIPLWVPFVIAVANDLGPRLDRIGPDGTLTNADMTDLYRFGLRWALLFNAVWFLYQALMIGLWSATVGKFALGLRVRRSEGTDVTWREALLRPILPVATSVIPGAGIVGLLDYLWMLWDRQKQCLHDKIASTIVVVVR